MRNSFVSVILALSISNLLLAAAADPDKEKLRAEELSRWHHEVTVTAAPVLKAVRDCSPSVSILDEFDIRAVRPHNALAALNGLAGIFVQRTGDFGRADVEIRGLGQRGQRLMILVDGRPEKMGLFGCAVTHAFPLDNVERIEVVRGPSSVLFGPDALGGVVNILTRRPPQGFHTDLTASYGAYDTLWLTLRHSASLGKFQYNLTFDRQASDGHVAHSSYSGISFTSGIVYDFVKDWSLSFHLKCFDGKKHEPGPAAFPVFTSWNDYHRGAVDIGLNGTWKSAEIQAKFFHDFGRHRFSDGWHSRDAYSGGSIRMNFRLRPNNVLTAGTDVRLLTGKSYNFPRGSWRKNDAGLFIHDEQVFGRRWIVSAGARLDRDSNFGWEFCPQTGFVFKAANSTSLRISVSKGFRSPHLNELFMFPPSNPDLKPERVWNAEFGIEQSIGSRVSVTAAVFRMKGSNLIETGLNPGSKPLYKFFNLGRFDFRGAEIGFRAVWPQGVTTRLSYSALDPGALTKGKPGHKIDADFRWRSGRIEAFLNAQSVTRYYADNHKRLPIPSYFLVNGRLEFAVGRAVTLFADFNNILGADYQIYVDLSGLAAGLYRMPGRNLHIGARLRT